MNDMLKNKYHAYTQMYGELPSNRRLNSAKPIVIDTGSEYTKVGYAGDDKPKYTFRTLVAEKDGKKVVGDAAASLSNN